ncbi:ER export of PMA1 protein 1 [Monosporozyma unispora]|nr:hypothetical protein C6P44_003282 [Kazachstania unispora]
MDFYAYFILLFVVILFVVILPLLSGIGSFKVNKSTSNKGREQARSERLKFKLNKEKKLRDDATDNSIGVSSSTLKKTGKFEIDSKTGLKKRVIGTYIENEDPNTFDFDVDDLINEDEEEEKREQLKRRNKFKGREYAASESFV